MPDPVARAASRATRAQPPATVSRQPVAPQRQGRPSAASIRVCPISPAAPRWPTTTRPSATMPSPRPVEAFTTRASRSAPPGAPRAARSAPARRRRCATKSGASRDPARYGASATPSQPAITGESRLTPRAGVDGAGQAQPDRRDGRLDVGEQRGQPLDDLRHQLVGPDADLVVARSRRRARRRRGRRRPSWLRERPIATASTTPASLLKTRRPGGRPPVEASSSPTSSSPAVVSAAGPGRRPRSARDR